MSKLKDNSLQYKTEIKHGFEALEPGNNHIISTEKLNDFTKVMNSKKNNPFLYNTIKSLTTQKEEENEENISYEEYMSFIDDQLDDVESKDGLKKIFSVFCDSNQSNFSWTKLPLIVKELGDNEMANKLLKLIEQADLYNKDLNFKEFSEMMNTEYENEKNTKNDISEDYEDIESYKQKKLKYKKKEEYEEGTVSSKNSYKDKNEDNKKSGEDNDGEKSNKRYHRRYRDNKTKNDNNENGSGTNKVHSKYRKKHV